MPTSSLVPMPSHHLVFDRLQYASNQKWDVLVWTSWSFHKREWQLLCHIVCWLSHQVGWVESFPSDNQTSETIVRLLVDHVICPHGVPEALILVCKSWIPQLITPKLMGYWRISTELCKPCLPNMLQKLVWIGMNISITCYLHIELNPMNIWC